jgi:hypothetical protein
MMFDYSAPFPNPDVYYAHCTKCGHKVNSEEEQHYGLCGHCKKLAKPLAMVVLKEGTYHQLEMTSFPMEDRSGKNG